MAANAPHQLLNTLTVKDDADIEDGVVHHPPSGFSDHFALTFTKTLRLIADTFLPNATAIAPSFWRRLLPCPVWLALPQFTSAACAA